MTHSGGTAEPVLFQRKSSDLSSIIVRSRHASAVWPLVEAVVKQLTAAPAAPPASNKAPASGIEGLWDTPAPAPQVAPKKPAGDIFDFGGGGGNAVTPAVPAPTQAPPQPQQPKS